MIGLLGKKLGMSAIYDDKGRYTAVTAIKAGPCPVVQVKTAAKDGYSALQLGFGAIRSKLVNKPEQGHFKKHNVELQRKLHEIRDFDGDRQVGEVLKVDLFQPGDVINVTGVSKGRGFAGVIKRHGYHRPNQTHGTHEAFRGGGSIGQASYPARVWPGTKMPGHMGNHKVTVKNLVVLRIDAEQGILLVKGAVPGAAGGILVIKKK